MGITWISILAGSQSLFIYKKTIAGVKLCMLDPFHISISSVVCFLSMPYLFSCLASSVSFKCSLVPVWASFRVAITLQAVYPALVFVLLCSSLLTTSVSFLVKFVRISSKNSSSYFFLVPINYAIAFWQPLLDFMYNLINYPVVEYIFCCGIGGEPSFFVESLIS